MISVLMLDSLCSFMMLGGTDDGDEHWACHGAVLDRKTVVGAAEVADIVDGVVLLLDGGGHFAGAELVMVGRRAAHLLAAMVVAGEGAALLVLLLVEEDVAEQVVVDEFLPVGHVGAVGDPALHAWVGHDLPIELRLVWLCASAAMVHALGTA